MGDLLQRLKRRNEDGNYNMLNGLEILTADNGYAEVLLPVRPEVLNQLGNVHGGAIYTLCDVAAGTATASTGRVGVTLSGSMNYLRPGSGDADLLAKTTQLKCGRTTAVYSVDVYQKERIIASGQFTMYFTGYKLCDLY